MKIKFIHILIAAILIALPYVAIAQIEMPNGVESSARIFSYVNFALLVTSFISIVQYLFKSDTNRSVYHYWHLLSVILYFVLSIYFLTANKAYYLGYENLSDMQCVKKYFLAKDSSSFKQWFIALGGIANILYIIRNRKNIL
jgi:hypothetical protein